MLLLDKRLLLGTVWPNENSGDGATTLSTSDATTVTEEALRVLDGPVLRPATLSAIDPRSASRSNSRRCSRS